MTDRPDVSVIIVNHYADRILGDCIGAVASALKSVCGEIIIIDNPPAGESETPLGASDIPVTRIPSHDRVGFGAACNLGVEHASGDYLLFLNPDVVVQEDAIEHLRNCCEKKTDIGAVIGRLTLPDGTVYPTCRNFPTILNLLFSHGSVLGRLPGIRRGRYMLPDYDDTTEVDWGSAALLMMRREIFSEISGFDERFFMYLEDTDLCYRLHRAGYRNFYVPQARGVHYWGYSTGRYPFRRIIWHHRSIWRYFAKHDRSLSTRALLGPLLAVNCLLSLTVELFTLRR